MNLKESLRDWQDYITAAFQLALDIGLMVDEPLLYQVKAKHVFWTNNPILNMLTGMIDRMAEAGVLERNDDNEFRWNPNFVGSWELTREQRLAGTKITEVKIDDLATAPHQE
jgi:hypothetical protein